MELIRRVSPLPKHASRSHLTFARRLHWLQRFNTANGRCMSALSRLSTRSLFSSSENDVRARHLLRALLREASYLPDATCRSFVHHRVIARYRDFSQASKLSEEKFESLIYIGYKSLRQLQRANNGELRGLTRVFEHTYGRAGKRRYELIKPLLQEQKPAPTAGARSMPRDETPEAYDPPLRLPRAMEQPVRTQKDTLKFRISPRFPLLHSLVYSQSKQSPNLFPERHIKSPTFDMPLRNLWQRIQPRKRQKNAAARWYAETLDNILPPLPEDEWMRLYRLASGQIRWRGAPRKRAPAEIQNAVLDMPDQEPFVTPAPHDVTSVDASEATLAELLESQLRVGPSEKPGKLSDGRDVGHTITPRFMRRLYRAILSRCPLMKYDKESATWTVTWYDPKRDPLLPQSVSDASQSATGADGVPATGASKLASLFGAAEPHKAK